MDKAKKQQLARRKDKTKKKRWDILKYSAVLALVVLGGVLFVGAVSGWFNNGEVVLDAEYYGDTGEFLDLTAEQYDVLIREKKSFVVFVDQRGCTTADRLREYAKRYMAENNIIIYRMMFADMKETSLHEKVKYYPSVAIVSKGDVVGYLRADSDEDAEYYNNYEKFDVWMDGYLGKK